MNFAGLPVSEIFRFPTLSFLITFEKYGNKLPGCLKKARSVRFPEGLFVSLFLNIRPFTYRFGRSNRRGARPAAPENALVRLAAVHSVEIELVEGSDKLEHRGSVGLLV